MTLREDAGAATLLVGIFDLKDIAYLDVVDRPIGTQWTGAFLVLKTAGGQQTIQRGELSLTSNQITYRSVSSFDWHLGSVRAGGSTADLHTVGDQLVDGFRVAIGLCSGNTDPGTTSKPQAQMEFATCGWWRNISEGQQVYKVAFAQGVVVGSLAQLISSPSTTDELALSKYWDEGQLALLRKPALMAEVFDKQCGDYRNTRLYLHHVAFLGTLEIGGVPEARIEAALELFRSPDTVPYATIFATLLRK